MLRLRDLLTREDRAHLARILAPSAGKNGPKVERFLADDTFLAEEALEPFKALSQHDRERLLSDLLWRIACHVDGSITKVMGVNVYSLGAEFSAVVAYLEG